MFLLEGCWVIGNLDFDGRFFAPGLAKKKGHEIFRSMPFIFLEASCQLPLSLLLDLPELVLDVLPLLAGEFF